MYALTCESTVDLTQEYAQKRNIQVLPYSYVIDGVEYLDKMDGVSAEFYAAIKNGKFSTTSQICTEKYKEFFREQLEKGDLLHIVFDSGLSNSINNAYAAAEEVKKEYPNRKIYVVDSTCGCLGYGLFVDVLADMRDSLNTIEETYDWAMEHRKNVHHHFFSTTLKYFRKSGRISGPAALIGDLLKLCPIMRVNNEGKIIAYNKAMSVAKAISKTEQVINDNIFGGVNYGDRLWIAHSDCEKYAEALKERLKQTYPHADIRIWKIGPVIGSHCGPGTVSVYFWGNEREK